MITYFCDIIRFDDHIMTKFIIWCIHHIIISYDTCSYYTFDIYHMLNLSIITWVTRNNDTFSPNISHLFFTQKISKKLFSLSIGTSSHMYGKVFDNNTIHITEFLAYDQYFSIWSIILSYDEKSRASIIWIEQHIIPYYFMICLWLNIINQVSYDK